MIKITGYKCSNLDTPPGENSPQTLHFSESTQTLILFLCAFCSFPRYIIVLATAFTVTGALSTCARLFALAATKHHCSSFLCRKQIMTKYHRTRYNCCRAVLTSKHNHSPLWRYCSITSFSRLIISVSDCWVFLPSATDYFDLQIILVSADVTSLSFAIRVLRSPWWYVKII